MKIGDLFAQVDELKPNQYEDSLKLLWLNEVEGRIVKELVETSIPDETMEDFVFNGYAEETPLDTELIAKEPYAVLYRYYLFAMIDLANEETDRFQNNSIMFNQAYSDFANYWNRTHKHKGPCRFRN